MFYWFFKKIGPDINFGSFPMPPNSFGFPYSFVKELCSPVKEKMRIVFGVIYWCCNFEMCVTQMAVTLNNSLINIGSAERLLRILYNFIQVITLNIRRKLKFKLYACFIVTVLVQQDYKVSTQKYVPLN